MPPEKPAKGTARAVRIGKYEVLAHIATGGMGAVYKARDTELDRVVALKVLPPEMAADPAALARFKREAQHAAKLRHENIVTIYDVGEHKSTHFIALEFIDGIDLHDYLRKKGKLDPEEARRIIIQAVLALHHAHQQGIVHRDIKPSNFLVTRRGGQMVIKLTDFGLAREATPEEGRVTRSGTTVGTVDYISPEQARDSGAADIRSDLYSLGCTLFHMLAGRPPFHEGSLTERIYKHCTVEPPDIRQLNPKVPEAMCAILSRMLAKKPADRYPTPAALLKDLLALNTAPAPVSDRSVLAGLAFAADEEVPDDEPEEEEEPSSDGMTKEDEAPAEGGDDAAASAKADATAAKPEEKPWQKLLRQRPRPAVIWGVAAAIAATVVFGGLIALQMDEDSHRPREQPGKESGSGPLADAGPKDNPDPPKDQGARKDAGKKDPPKPEAPRWPALYKPSAPLDLARLQQDYQGPWTAPPAVPADAPVFRVSRVNPHAAGVAAPAGTAFDSLAAACAAAPAGKMTIIEIHDNGPLFEKPVVVSGRSLFLRAGTGYRPLIVWDTSRKAAPRADAPPEKGETTFLSVSQGNLLLRGVDFAVKWDVTRTEPACFLRVAGGDLMAYLCTFSIGGRNRDGVTVARFEPGEAKPAEGAAPRCRFSQCFGRGNSLVVLDVRSPRAEVLLDQCLFVVGDSPLIRVSDHKDAPATVRLVRSTLVGRQTLLQVRPAGDGATSPGLRWMGWDALLARAGTSTGGVLVDLPPGADASAMQWRAVNCLYVGWQTLLSGREPITASAFDAWRRRWGITEGDAVQPDPWQGADRAELAEVSPFLYLTDKTPLAFTATFGKGLLGCDLLTFDQQKGALPPAREAWLALTHDRYLLPRLDMVRDLSPPEIPVSTDGRYTGERLDAEKVDLGAHLDAVQKGRKLAPVVVMHLAGSGQRASSAIRVRGATLVLYFEPPAEKAEPLTLLVELRGSRAKDQDALIQVDGGSLEIVGGRLRTHDFGTAQLPPYLLLARGGDVRAHGCRLQGPCANPPDGFWGLVRVEGTGDVSPDKVRGCALHQCVLLSPRMGVHVAGPGARVILEQCLAVTGTETLHLQPGPKATDRLNMQCILEHTTVASRRAVAWMDDVPHLGHATEPAILQTKACVYQNPFIGKDRAPVLAGVLLYQGYALPRGLLAWQADGDVFDKRLHFFAAPATAEGAPYGVDKLQPRAAWSRAWGPLGEHQATYDVSLRGTIDFEKLQLERLALPSYLNLKGSPGANLTRLLKKGK